MLRTPEQHDLMCDHLQTADDATYHSTTYGVNRRTPLNDLQFYHVCDLGLPPDVMHDLLEGYVPYKTKLMLKHYIQEEKLFTLDELNARIRNFRYGYMETKPTVIFPNTFSAVNDAELNQSGTCNCKDPELFACMCTIKMCKKCMVNAVPAK